MFGDVVLAGGGNGGKVAWRKKRSQGEAGIRR